ncbi:NnrU family protein [Pararhizobium haloflavum]|uniref:NnrU family protein n=1 Tax=Pararhizobium haloflavum TaxID=2037914 RepID=UPI000C194747|nr:NnrU family protein [Pararhizobium haloflavum]
MLILILGIVLFLGVHSVRIAAPDYRARFIAERGEGAWKGLYTVVSVIGLALIVWGFGMARQTAPILYAPPAFMAHLALLLMIPAMVFLAASQVPAGRIKAAVKHPMLLAVKIWALAHLLANGDLASLILFLSFLAWAVADRISEKRRLRAGETRAVVAGPARNDIIAVGVGLVLYLLFVWKLHAWLIGVAPIA